MSAASPAQRQLALDVYDWCHVLGHGATTRQRWASVFRRGKSEELNERQWLKLRARWRRAGVPFELVEEACAGQARQVLVKLPREAKAWAEAVLR